MIVVAVLASVLAVYLTGKWVERVRRRDVVVMSRQWSVDQLRQRREE